MTRVIDKVTQLKKTEAKIVKEIAQIQAKCNHKWQVKPVIKKLSLVSIVFFIISQVSMWSANLITNRNIVLMKFVEFA